MIHLPRNISYGQAQGTTQELFVGSLLEGQTLHRVHAYRIEVTGICGQPGLLLRPDCPEQDRQASCMFSLGVYLCDHWAGAVGMRIGTSVKCHQVSPTLQRFNPEKQIRALLENLMSPHVTPSPLTTELQEHVLGLPASCCDPQRWFLCQLGSCIAQVMM